ncbi:hypothetical protein EDD18DRAFT_1105227 [Armillaria luteobubalina]|uniref:Uncharacterized protein n=1 Tax=Armillaria luteobubalina TaxID=153913 RepID=A0AA39Q7S6_9AGAR|nr:hypothetical protein EDD18DRAFT_1105227 [Armillaria luteobubalina]
MSVKTSSFNETLLLDKNGKVLKSLLIFPGSKNGPVIQSLNAGNVPYPWPPAIYVEKMDKEPQLVEVDPEFLSSVKLQMHHLRHQAALNVQHWFQLYGFRKGSEKEQAFDREIKEEYPAQANSQGKYSLGLTTGLGWDSTLSPQQAALLQHLKLHSHGLRGGVFNLSEAFDCYLLNCYLKNNGPTFILHLSPSHLQKYQFWQVDYLAICQYHCFNKGNLSCLNCSLDVSKIPQLANNVTLMLVVTSITLDKEQGQLPKGTQIWQILLIKYHYQLVKARSKGAAGQAYFHMGHELCNEEVDPLDLRKKDKQLDPHIHWPVRNKLAQFPWAADPSAPGLEKRKERHQTPYLLTKRMQILSLESLGEESLSGSSMPELESYFLTSRENVAIIKIQSSLDYTIAEVLSTGMPFQPEFVELGLNDCQGIKILLEGPSYIAANLNHAVIVTSKTPDGEELVTEPITMDEEKVCIHTWTRKAEALMEKPWAEVMQGEALALTMEEWKTYIVEFKQNQGEMMDLMDIAYLVDWLVIKHDALIMPEVFRGYNVKTKTV